MIYYTLSYWLCVWVVLGFFYAIPQKSHCVWHDDHVHTKVFFNKMCKVMNTIMYATRRQSNVVVSFIHQLRRGCFSMFNDRISFFLFFRKKFCSFCSGIMWRPRVSRFNVRVTPRIASEDRNYPQSPFTERLLSWRILKGTKLSYFKFNL